MDHDTVVGTTFVIYLLALLGIGVVAYRRTHDLADYILGGRRLGSWVTALSAGASDMSGWLLLGLPGYAYATGFEAGWIALGLFAGTWLNWQLVAPRLRADSLRAGNALTLPQYFETRFGDPTGLLRILSAFFILLFFTFYTSSGLVAGGKLFESVFGFSYLWAVGTGAAAIIVYTFLGGFLAVSWTDFFQGLLMAAALVIVPALALVQLGGWEGARVAMAASNPHLLDVFSNNKGEALGVLAILSLLGWGLGYFGQPHILARFMAIRSTRAIPKARRIALSWVAVTLAGALLAGWAGIGAAEQALSGAATEKIFINLVGQLLHPLPAGIALAAILAAIMSTADSQLLVASSALTSDLYQGSLRKEASAAELVWVGRGTVILIAVIAFVLAANPDRKVLDLVAYAWAGFGAAFGPTLLLGLYWPRMNWLGALAGILTGGITVIAWKPASGGIFDLYEIVPGFLLSTLAIVLVSALTPAPPAQISGAIGGRARRT